MKELKLSMEGKLPGEGLIVALIENNTVRRATMSQANRDEADRILNAMLKGWHNWWVLQGWPGESV